MTEPTPLPPAPALRSLLPEALEVIRALLGAFAHGHATPNVCDRCAAVLKADRFLAKVGDA